MPWSAWLATKVMKCLSRSEVRNATLDVIRSIWSRTSRSEGAVTGALATTFMDGIAEYSGRVGVAVTCGHRITTVTPLSIG